MTAPAPDDDGMQIVMPFVVVRSKGGPYDDDAFTAGWQAGEIDHALRTAAASGATTIRYPMVRAALAPQLDLIGMRHGYPTVRVQNTGDGWADVTFVRELAAASDG